MKLFPRLVRYLHVLTASLVALSACAPLSGGGGGASLAPQTACRAGTGSACGEEGVKQEFPENGTPPDIKAAGDYYRQGCDLKDGLSCFNLGLLYFNGKSLPKDPVKAKTLWEKSCRLQAAQACYNLGAMLAAGNSPARNAKAGAYFRLACNLKYTQGCKSLGALFREEGERLLSKAEDTQNRNNEAEAARHFTQGCQLGDGPSCTRLGLMREEGKGDLPRDPEEALSLFKRGCDAGDGAGCQSQADRIEKKSEAQPESVALLEKACSLGVPGACTELGLRHVRGDRGVPASLKLAADYYEKACALNDGPACYNTAQLFSSGTGSPSDAARAKEFYDKSCRLGAGLRCPGNRDKR